MTAPAPSSKPIAVLMATVAVDMLGAAMVFPLVPFYALKLAAQPWAIGWILAGYHIAQLATAPLWGRFSDRVGRRPALIAGLTGSALGFVVFGLADGAWLLLLARLVQGAGGGTTAVAQAYVGDAVGPEKRVQALGWLSAATSFGVMLGPVLGSFASRLDHAAPGFLAALLCLVNVGFAWRWLAEPPRDRGAGAAASARRPLRRVVAEVLRRPLADVSLLIWVYAVGMLGFMSMTAVMGLYLQHRFGVSEREIGWFFLLTGGIGILMRGALLGRLVDWLGEVRLMRLGALLIAAGLAAMTLPGSIPGFLPCLALVPVGTACLFPATSALVSRRAPRAELGQVLGVQQSFGGVARVLAPISSTAIFQAFGPRPPFLVAAAVVAAVGVLALRVRPLPGAATAQAARAGRVTRSRRSSPPRSSISMRRWG